MTEPIAGPDNSKQTPGDPPNAPAGSPPRIIRFLARVCIAATVLLIIGFVGIRSYINHSARLYVERITTKALNLTVTVDTVTVNPIIALVHFVDFRIASPSGFPQPYILNVPAADMGITHAELQKSPAHISSIRLISPRLTLASDGTALNLVRLIQGLPHSAKPARVIIDEVTVQDPIVILSNLDHAKGETEIPVSTFTIRNIGANSHDGVQVKDALIQVLMAVASRAGDSPRMPEQYRALLHMDVAGMIRLALPDRIGRALSAFFGSSLKTEH